MRSPPAPLRRPTLEWFAVTLFCVLLSVLSAAEGWLWRIDLSIYDGILSSWSRPVSTDVAIISIDDASLARIGPWPWSRRTHAALIDRAHRAGASAIVLDVLLDAPSREDPGADIALAQALRNHGQVILPLAQAVTGAVLSGETLPLAPFAEAAAALGHSQTEFDPDGITRSVYLWEGFGGAHHPQLALALLRVVDPQAARNFPPPTGDSDAEDPQWERADWLRIPFAGPPGTYTHYSYQAVLSGEIPASELQGKILLIGATATGMGDAVPTPTSGLSRPMPGVEVQANVFDEIGRASCRERV